MKNLISTNLIKKCLTKCLKYSMTVVYKLHSILNHEPNKASNKLELPTIKKGLKNWILEKYQPTHFLSIRLPKNWASENLSNSLSHLQLIMKTFEKKLLGRHWNRHHFPFIAFAEKGVGFEWHYHILFNHEKFTKQDLQNAILYTTGILKLPAYCLDLKLIENQPDTVIAYCIKEMKIYDNNSFNSDRIILSHDLFQLPHKNN